MKSDRTKFTLWLSLAVSIFVLLPTFYISSTREPLDLDARRALIFNVDTAERVVNYVLYHLGISGNPNQVIVGKEGWLFLGDYYDNTLTHSRNGEFSQQHVDEGVRWFVDRRQQILSIATDYIHVMPPNKLSIYPELLPDWLILPAHNITDRFIESAASLGLPLLDLRAELMARKSAALPLYYRTDSHWNHYTGAMAYKAIVEQLKAQGRLDFESVENVSIGTSAIGIPAGGSSVLLKINGLLAADYDQDVRVDFPGSRDDICIRTLDPHSLKPSGDCHNQPNSMFHVTRPLLVENPAALNAMTVIWYRDSFGTAMSSLVHKTFGTVWEVPNRYFYYRGAIDFIKDVEPSLVMFMAVERYLVARVVDGLPDSAADLGSNNFCAEHLCGPGEGDCDNDDQCQTGLVCTDNAGLKYGFRHVVDVCEAPPAAIPGSNSYCKQRACGIGEGDCDSDLECLPGLVCVDNGGARHGFRAVVDVCEMPDANRSGTRSD